MINQTFPSVNEIAPSWADIEVTLTVADGGQALSMIDIAAVKWSRSVEVGEQRGATGGRVKARTTGSGSQESSMTLYRSGLRKMIKALIEKAPERGNQKVIGLVSFDVLIQHTPLGETEIYKTKIKGCRYLGDSDDMQEGNEADKIEVTLNPIEVVQIINGVEVVLI